MKFNFQNKNDDYETNILIVKEKIKQADAVVIGAGAGLSTAAGYIYNGERFDKYFSDFKAKYGFTDMYSGGFYPYPSREEFWAYWSRYIHINRYVAPPKNTYEKLLELVKDKDYFVITTNVDHCFQRAGFDKKRLFYTQGDYGLFQCSVPCHNETYDNEDIINKMFLQQKDMKIPSNLIPKCPVCGEEMTTNLRSDNTFVQDKGWDEAAERYELFIKRHKNLNIVFLEIGIGYNTPVIIKYPFWQMTAQNKNAFYVCINFDDAECPQEIASQAACIQGDADMIIKDLVD